MKNKGQALVCFIILLPVIITIIGVVIEFTIVTYQKAHLVSISKSIIANCLDGNEKNDIIKLYNDNNIAYENMKIDLTNGISISFTSKIDSFFGNIFQKDYYEVTISLSGYKENNQIKYKKG